MIHACNAPRTRPPSTTSSSNPLKIPFVLHKIANGFGPILPNWTHPSRANTVSFSGTEAADNSFRSQKHQCERPGAPHRPHSSEWQKHHEALNGGDARATDWVS
jgi:hypothetical protein